MGTVAPTDGKQVLADELAVARSLIEAGEYEAALDRLGHACETAQAWHDGARLGEVRALARTVRRRAPSGSDTVERADALIGAAMRTWTGTSSPIPTAGSSDSFSARQSPLAQVGCMVCALLLAVFGVFWISGMTFVGDYMGWDLRLVLWTVVGAGLLFLGAVLSFARAITDRIPRVLVVTLLGLLAAAVGTSVAMYETSRGTSRAPERTTTAPDTTKPLIGKAVTFGQHPVAGKRFDVRFDVMRSSGGPMLDGAMVCTPTVAGKVIRHTEEFISGSAWLFASIPKTAKGKLLAVKLTIRANGHAASKTITFPIH